MLWIIILGIDTWPKEIIVEVLRLLISCKEHQPSDTSCHFQVLSMYAWMAFFGTSNGFTISPSLGWHESLLFSRMAFSLIWRSRFITRRFGVISPQFFYEKSFQNAK